VGDGGGKTTEHRSITPSLQGDLQTAAI
jgi:hypothetical protein